MPKRMLQVVIGLIILFGIGGAFAFSRLSKPSPGATIGPVPTPAPVNVIAMKDRPYATLQPLPGRNELELAIFNLPKKADSVEVTLEYDRNKGVLDAVLKQFNLTSMPLKQMIFLGTKSAGGHITYHEDVVGGTMTLKFLGTDAYTLKVPWRYDDTAKEYQNLSTTDGFFQVALDKPVKQPKIIVMQSPGAPEGLASDPIAGPYLIRTVGDLPSVQAMVKIRMPDAAPNAVLWGYDGAKWTKIPATIEGKTVSASAVLLEAYAVTL